MKKALSLFLSIVLVLGVFLSVPFTGSPFKITAEAASSGTCGDNLTWTLDNSGVLTISGTGAMTNYSYTSVPWYSSRSSIKEVVINKGVTSIGKYAFYWCDSLTSVTIGDSVTSIGYGAFSDCTSLTSITIPDSVTSIGDYAFSSCDTLTSVTIGDSVTSIGYKAFYDCTSLTAINVSSSNQYYTSVDGILYNRAKTKLIQYPAGKTSTSYTIPDSVTSIGDYAFSSCDTLTSITIPDSVTSIGDYAFYYCYSLTSITIPDSVTSIGDDAFYNCSRLTSITIPDSVTSIGYDAFSYCYSLTSITIPDSVTSIGDNAFWNCDGLTSVNVSSNNQYYTSVDGVLFNKAKTELIRYPAGKTSTSYTIPNSVTSIGDAAFYRCKSLTSITIPDSVTSIGDDAFGSCYSLTSVTIGDSVTSIGGYAFFYCTSLTSITIPDSVTSIGREAFYNCYSLTSITIGNSVTRIGDWAFYDCDSLSDVYYSGSLEDWSNISIGNYNDSLFNATVHCICWITDKAATCTVAGSKHKECRECGETLETETIPATGHTVVIDSSKAPTCTETGLTEGSHCSVCNAVIIAQDIVSATGHNGIMVPGTPATCTQPGNTDYGVCSVCETVLLKTTTIPATGHTSSDWITDKAATCTVAGSKHKECTVCGGTLETETISATGRHTVVIDSSKAPTCTETGLTEGSHCSVCGAVLTAQSEVAVIAHTPSNWITDKAATCTVAGSRHKACTVCGKTLETQTISATGHTESGWITDKAATCTVAGSKHKECTVCGKTLETQTISATGHTESSWITDKAATVNAAGSKYKRCTVCGNTLETAVIPQLTCAAPTLSSVMNANGGVTVTWKAVSGADSYRVYRKTASSGWSSISSKVTSTSYTDKAAKSGTTYYYTVRAENEAGLSGYNSTGISIKHLAMPTVTVANDATGVKVSWNKIAGATGYYVYRKANGEWTRCAMISDGSTVSYTDTNRKTGSTYSYSVMAYDSTTTSDYNPTGVSVKYLAMPTVTIANAATGVKVSWNKITGASKYYVYRKASSEKSWTQLTNSATGTSYTDTKAKSGTTYYYTVKAVSGSVASASKSSSALKYLAQPKVSSLSNTNSGITVKWGKITGASGYYVYRKTGSGSWSLIYTAKSGSTVSYTDKSAKAGTTYYYTVRAYSGSVKSTYTSSTAIRRLTTPTLKSVSSATNGITFKWNKVTGASGYYVYRKTGSGSWQKIATVKSGSTVSYLDKTAKKGTTYTYTVKAYYGSNVSAYNTTGLKIKDKY